MERRIQKIILDIENLYLQDFQKKLTEILSFCESPIEEMMLLQFYNLFQNNNASNLKKGKETFYDIQFTEDYIYPINDDDVDAVATKEFEYLLNKARKLNYRFSKTESCYQKYNGFKINLNFMPHEITSSREELISRTIYIYPQYDVNIKDSFFRIDIAFILVNMNFNTNEIISTKKIALECDGYNYHSSPDQIMNDEKRSRKLKSNGWDDVLRYSGKEIYRINDSLEKINYNFIEIMEIILKK